MKLFIHHLQINNEQKQRTKIYKKYKINNEQLTTNKNIQEI